LKIVSVINDLRNQDDFKNQNITKIPVGNVPVDISVNKHTNLVYVTNKSNTISVINGSSDRLIKNIHVPSGMNRHLEIDPQEDWIFVTNEPEGNMSVIDGRTNNLTNVIRVGNGPFGMAVNTIINRIYIANHDSNTVSVMDYKTISPRNIVFSSISNITINNPSELAVNSATNMVYVVSQGSGTVKVINGSSNKSLKDPIPVGHLPSALKVNPVTNLIYVTAFGSNSVSVINGTSNKLIAVINFTVSPKNSGNIYCSKPDDPHYVNVNVSNHYIRYSSDEVINCKAIAKSGLVFSHWDTELQPEQKNDYFSSLYNWIASILHIQDKDMMNLKVTKYGTLIANFEKSNDIVRYGNYISIIVLAIVLFITIFITARPEFFRSNTLFKRLLKLPILNNIGKQGLMWVNESTIIQIDASVIVGILFLLSLTAIDRSQLTGITASIIFPFAISAVAVLIKHRNFGTKLMITGFINLIISISLLSIIIFLTGNSPNILK
jgi:YVTN family beta-propeller protein